MSCAAGVRLLARRECSERATRGKGEQIMRNILIIGIGLLMARAYGVASAACQCVCMNGEVTGRPN